MYRKKQRYKKRVLGTNMETMIEECRKEYTSKETWDSIFSKKYNFILQNVDLLFEECEKYEECEKNEECENNENNEKITNFYESEIFQDFVDRHVDFKKIGAYNYQVFCKSMNDKEFQSKIYERYEKDEKVKKIKNHLIYFVLLKHQVSSDSK